ncbi:MAG: chorismate-binding protein, partial [Bacillota bacterium]|nr:chorismate-binding protein [Bacillota bacterium]
MHNQAKQYQLLFEFADRQGLRSPLLFEDPVEIIEAYSIEEVKPGLEKIQASVQSGYYAAGYISYEAAPAFDQAYAVHSRTKMPLLWFGLFKQPLRVQETKEEKRFKVGEWLPDTTFKQYRSDILSIKDAIEKGDTYQVNYTIRLHSRFTGDDLGFYRQLAKAQAANYSAYLNIGKY